MRKTISTILLVSLWTQMLFAAGVPQKFPTDTLQIGKPSSSANKDLIFDTNLGASNPKVRANPTSGKFELNKPLDVTGAIGATGAISTTSGDISTASGNLSATGTGLIGGDLTLGTGAAADKSITVNRGGSNPFLKWSETALSWIFSNDGTLEKKLGTGGGGGSTGVNVLTNDSFEDFVSGALLGWSNVGGTLTQATYTNGVENDTKYFQFVATGAGQYFESALITVPTNFNGGGCQVDFKKLNIATNDLFKVEALDSSSNVLATGNVKISSWSKFPTLSFSCPTAGSTFRVRVTSLAAGTLQGDKAYLGSNQNIVNLSQAMLVFKGNFPLTSGCTVSHDNATLGAFSSVSACPEVVSEFSSGGVIPALTDFDKPTKFALNNLKAGYYKVTFFGAESYTSGGNTSGRFAINDGVTTSPMGYATNTTSVSVGMNFSAVFYYNASQSSRTFELFGADDLSPIQMLSTTTTPMNVLVEYYPSDSETAVSPEQSSWFIDANIGGANVVHSSLVSSYTEITSPSLNLVVNTNKGSANAEIACASGTLSTGLTCTSNESAGIAFEPGAGNGLYEVCSAFTIQTSAAGGESAYQLVETPNNSTTILQEGGERLNVYASNADVRFPIKICGNFNFSDVSKKTIRLMYEKPNTTISSLFIDRSAGDGQRDMKWTIRPLLSAYNRPILTGDQVTTEGVVNPKFYSAFLSTTGAVANEKGDLINGSCVMSGTGSATFTCPTLKFTSKPNCQCSVSDGVVTAANFSCQYVSTSTASSLIFFTTANGALTPRDMTVSCHGN